MLLSLPCKLSIFTAHMRLCITSLLILQITEIHDGVIGLI